MQLISRLVCRVVGHRPEGESVTYDATAGRFADVSAAAYTVCTRCGTFRPAKIEVVERTESNTSAQE